MRGIICIVCMMTATLASCTPRESNIVRYNNDGTEKPTVALVPVIETVSSRLPWSLSKELTEEIYSRMVKAGMFYIPSRDAILTHLAIRKDIMFSDIDFAQEAPDAEFVVLFELLEHKEVPYVGQKISPVYPKDGKKTSAIMMTVRLKVLDLRSEMPRVVLQEVIHSNHHVGEGDSFRNYQEIIWGSTGYRYTPMASAHARLSKGIVKHIEAYITYAKN